MRNREIVAIGIGAGNDVGERHPDCGRKGSPISGSVRWAIECSVYNVDHEVEKHVSIAGVACRKGMVIFGDYLYRVELVYGGKGGVPGEHATRRDG